MLNRVPSNSLIICLTPLQVLIAKEIIRINSNQIFDFILITNNKNDKYKYYYDVLKEICIKSYFYSFSWSSSFLNFLNFLNFKKSIGLEFEFKKYSSIYVASIDSRHIQYIIGQSKKDINVYTFDDGLANIVKDSIYIKDKINFLKKIIFFIIGIKLDLVDIKKRSKLHYTIYSLNNNVSKKTKKIDLLNMNFLSGEECKKKVRIFIGQPYSELLGKDFDEIYKILDILKVDFYFPHPREKQVDKIQVNVIKTHLVFEDYLLNYIKENNCDVEVYSFLSSAAANVINIKSVKVNILYNKYLYSKYSDMYLLFKEMGAKIIECEVE